MVLAPEDYMERFLEKDLREWKDSPDRRPLVIRGVRQCGKTELMKRFGVDGIVFGTGNISVDDKGVRHYPLFAAAFMDSIDVRPEVTVDLPDAEELNALFAKHRPWEYGASAPAHAHV